jgi:carbohydrate kinase (thermoresistant glucokinase family)
MKKAIFIMGVSGSGKTTIGKMLGKAVHIPFFDADDYHSVENINKMSKGIPLNDSDRRPGYLLCINLPKKNCKRKDA